MADEDGHRAPVAGERGTDAAAGSAAVPNGDGNRQDVAQEGDAADVFEDSPGPLGLAHVSLRAGSSPDGLHYPQRALYVLWRCRIELF